MIEKQKTEARVYEVDVKEEKLNKKFYLTHAVQIIAFAGLTGSLSAINYASTTSYWLAKIIQLTAFLIIGIVYVHLLKKSLFLVENKFKLNKLLFSIFLGLLIFLTLAILYLFLKPEVFIMSLASGCVFLLPAVLFSAYSVYNGFTQAPPAAWYNYENIGDNRVTIYLNSIPVNIKLKRKYADSKEEIFSTTLPGHVVFGKLFNQFLVNNNNYKSIEVADEKQNLYGWMFFKEDSRGSRRFYIDPEKTLRENNVKENLIIVAERLKKQPQAAGLK